MFVFVINHYVPVNFQNFSKFSEREWILSSFQDNAPHQSSCFGGELYTHSQGRCYAKIKEAKSWNVDLKSSLILQSFEKRQNMRTLRTNGTMIWKRLNMYIYILCSLIFQVSRLESKHRFSKNVLKVGLECNRPYLKM